MSSYFLSFSQGELFLLFPLSFAFLQVTPSEGVTNKDVSWKIFCVQPSAVTFALSFDSPLPLPQPSSPDKKEPLLRCFPRHYKTVAMDTQSEQAPHTGSRIGNDRCNISHFKNSSFSLQCKLMDRCVKNAMDQDPQNRSVRLLVVVCKAAFEGLFASCSTEVGWMVFSASFGLCCFSLKRWPILSRMGDQRRLSHCDPMKLASYKPRKSSLIAQLPHCTAKNGHEAKQ